MGIMIDDQPTLEFGFSLHSAFLINLGSGHSTHSVILHVVALVFGVVIKLINEFNLKESNS